MGTIDGVRRELDRARRECRERDAKIEEVAAFLDGMAERIEGLIQKPDPHGWRTEPTGPFILAATECRAMAAKLRGEI